METQTIDERRVQVHAMWAGVAPGWADHADYADARAAAVTERMLAAARPAPGERVLELACGPGGLGLAAAELVGPDGDVVLSDVAAEMTAIAAARAAERGLGNVSTLVLDIEEIGQPDAAYDVVLCREGLMFALDPARGLRRDRPRPAAGRPAVARRLGPARAQSVARPRVRRYERARSGCSSLPRASPARSRWRTPPACRGCSRTPASRTSRSASSTRRCRAGSFDEWWTRTSALAGPLAKLLAALPTEADDRIVANLREATAPYRTPSGGLELPGVTLLASAR